MTFLPIVDRELLMRARLGRTYWLRFTVGLCGALICVVQLVLGDTLGGAAAAGGYAFHGLVIAAFVICCGACLTTSDAISSERRDGTLGLLFLTRVRGRDVVLGKLASAGLVNVCAVLAFLPVLMIPVLSGGVTGGEAFRKGLVLLDTLFLALAVGLWASARGVESFKTARVAVGMVIAILALPFLLRLMLPSFGFPPYAIAVISPIFGLEAARDLAYQISAKPFWISLVVIHVLAWAMVLRAGVRLPKTLRMPERVTGDSIVAVTGTNIMAVRRPQLINADAPIGWLVRRQRGVRAMIWAAVGVEFLFFGLRFFLPFVGPGLGLTWIRAVMWPVALTQTAITGGLLAWASSRFFLEARRTGELELLVTTPLGAKTIVSEQWNVLLRMLYWPLGLMLVPPFFQMVMVWVQRGFVPGVPWQITFTFSTLFWMINSILAVLVLCRLGMWYGLKAPTQTGAIVRAVAWAKGVPYGLSAACMLVYSGMGRFGGPTYVPYLLISFLPQVVTFVFYLWLLRRVKRRLLGELRDAEPVCLSLTTDAARFWKNSVRAFQTARHWTPS